MPGVAAGAVAVGLMRSAASPYLSAQQIATELTSPTEKVYVFLVGDSHMEGFESAFFTSCPEIDWIGCGWIGASALDTVGHDTTRTVVDEQTPQVNAAYGGAIDWDQGGWIAEFTGVAEPAALIVNTRFTANLNFTQAACPLLWAKLIGKETVLRGFPYGITGKATGSPDICLWARVNNGSDDSASEPRSDWYDYGSLAVGEYGEVTCTLPAGWTSSANTIKDSWCAEKGAATTNGALVALSRVVVEGTANGVTLLNYAVGGAVLHTHFLDADVFPRAVFDSVLPLIRGTGSGLGWLDIGANGGDADGDFVAHVKELIALIRGAWGATTPVAILTAHDNSTDAGGKTYVERLYQVVREVSGVTILDTRAAFPAFAEGDALGYYADAAHLSATGKAVKAALIGDMWAEIVTNGANHQGYLGTDLTTDPMQVGVEFELSGVGTVGSAVVATVNGEEWGSTTCGSDGSWSITNTPTVAMRGAGTDVDVVVTFGPTRSTTRPTTIAAAA